MILRLAGIGSSTGGYWVGKSERREVLRTHIVETAKRIYGAPITEATPVKVEKAEEATGNLEFAIKVGEQDVTSIDQVENFVELSGDLGDSEAWKTLPESTLKDAVSIANGKLVITPVAGIDKLFLKVNIPQDAK